MNQRSKGAIVAAAVASLFAAKVALAQQHPGAEAGTKEAAKVKCEGINSCKGQGQCGGPGHDCAGKNECKGKGWIETTKEECEAKGGKIKS